MRKPFFLFSAALLAGASAVYAPAQEFQVERRDFVRHLIFSGELQAAESVKVRVPHIRSNWSFTLIYLAPEGSSIRRGDLLAEFDASGLLLRRLESEKKREDARIKIAQKEAEIETMRQNLLLQQAAASKAFKAAGLYVDLDPTLITRADAEKYQLDYSTNQLGLEKVNEQLATLKQSAQVELDLVRLEYDRADLKLKQTLGELRKMRVYAPIPGLVVHGENWNEGRKLQKGDTVFRLNTVILLPNMNRANVMVNVFPSDFSQLHEGMRAEVILDSIPGKTFPGRVMALPAAASPSRHRSLLKVFRVPVKLLKTDLTVMKPGMTARVTVPVVRKQALVVPRSTVQLGSQAETYVRRKGSLPQRVPVSVLDGNDHYLWVKPGREADLREGQTIVANSFEIEESRSDQIEWIPIRREDLTFVVPGNGVLRAEKAANIRPPALANHWQFKIVRMVEEGTAVKQGDFLLEFDRSEIQKRLREEESDYAKILQESEKTASSQELEMKNLELELEEAHVQKEKTENKLIRAREFEGMLKVREAEFDTVFARQRVQLMERKKVSVKKRALLQLEMLKEAEDFYGHRVDMYRKALNALLITAPTSGVVIYRTNRRNEKKAVGSPVWMTESILAIPDLSTLMIEGQVSEVDAGKVRTGGKVNVMLEAIPNQTFSGRIFETSQVFKQVSSKRPIKVFEIQVKLDRLDQKRMRPGMAARLSIIVHQFENVLSVPLSALHLENGKSYLWIREKGEAVRQEVKVGEDNGVAAVIESGLKAGDQVASRPLL